MPEKVSNPIFTRNALRKAAGSVYFARGEGYCESGVVRNLTENDGMIMATVKGTRTYRTTLWAIGTSVNGSCTCPLGRDEEFCKHLVATGLTYIEQQKSSPKKAKRKKRITQKDIETFLSKHDIPYLVRIIMEQADHDGDFYSMLKLRTAMSTDTLNTSEMKHVLQRAMIIDEFVRWNDTYEYSEGVGRVLNELETLLDPVHAASVIELAEYAMDLWEENIGMIDDSDGCMGDIRDNLHDLHLKACRIAKPDPVPLAERLVLRALSSEWEMFYDSYRTHNRVFGQAGRQRFREIVIREWEKLPTVKPGEEDPNRYGHSLRLEQMMLAFAEEDKDLDAAIRVISRDLSVPYTYLRIAERCRKARKHKLAIEWAEKGLAAFPDSRDDRLNSFLAEEYSRAKRPDDAMAVIWANFIGRPSLDSYFDLAKYARKLKCWDKWRKKAFDLIRGTIKDRQAEYERKSADHYTNRHGFLRRLAPKPPNHSLLVGILLWEKRRDDAWEEAQKGGCSNDLWLDLARQREEKHPEDAITIYRRQVEPLIDQTNNKAYKHAVAYLGQIHKLMKKIGKGQEFKDDLQRLKTEYKRKRNFIKFVEKKTWGK